MIGVGIHENIILKNVELVEKDGKYSVDFSLAPAGSSITIDDTDPFGEAVDENGMVITGGKNTTNIKVWPLQVPKETDKDGKTKSVKERVEEANKASQEIGRAHV